RPDADIAVCGLIDEQDAGAVRLTDDKHPRIRRIVGRWNDEAVDRAAQHGVVATEGTVRVHDQTTAGEVHQGRNTVGSRMRRCRDVLAAAAVTHAKRSARAAKDVKQICRTVRAYAYIASGSDSHSLNAAPRTAGIKLQAHGHNPGAHRPINHEAD